MLSSIADVALTARLPDLKPPLDLAMIGSIQGHDAQGQDPDGRGRSSQKKNRGSSGHTQEDKHDHKDDEDDA